MPIQCRYGKEKVPVKIFIFTAGLMESGTSPGSVERLEEAITYGYR